MNNKILVIVGPTAVGKTHVSIELAKKFNTEVISADSMQVYKHMNIGTAKVTEEEACGIKHHMIDLIEPDEAFSVSDFKKQAEKHIDNLLRNHKLPIIIGGSGLYVNSLIYDLNFGNVKSDEKVRQYYVGYYNEHGKDKLYDLLKKVDIEATIKIHKNNVKRVIRALEVCEMTGKKFSEMNTNIRKPSDKYECVIIGLSMDRELLYQRINKRVDIMVESGLIEEVQELLNKNYDRNLVSLQGIGYKEVIDYLDGKISKEESIEILKTNTRRFAKRQFTWFNGDTNIKWFDLSNLYDIDMQINNIYEYVLEGN
ncbi:tRNA (adenosine(37)-N6)-dimethylallyltransferase MiaA [Sedimentibacter sp. zth1]|uniref:tRNA (adenosine(37)-N6)-dimethylallyltransferase MiaA n=1 Tax=Sedimentibacter sp. zth1 TaxID=2816908 RepID=UPI001A915D89|nr:tRNA (adenosine(37)-N6)-dimethylallyltransferase MiaA [Sedimentibacter sp. zth1]QSX06508.1 tRNA (adenosine(37)-N6)-dimethylallyltransferase MiaA [Sedimentibacter sp. zth1]